MLVVGVLAAADVSRPTGRVADQGGSETAVRCRMYREVRSPYSTKRSGGLQRRIEQRTGRSPRTQSSRPSRKGSQTRHTGPMRGRSGGPKGRRIRLEGKADTGRRKAVGKHYEAFLRNCRARQSSRHSRHYWNSSTCRFRPGRSRRRRRTWHRRSAFLLTSDE